MSFLRNLASDLVEKKLWPFAAALLLALVAVPVVLGGGGSSDPASAPAAPTATTAPAPGAQAEVSLAEDATGARHRPGKVRDPFHQQHVAATRTATLPNTTVKTPATGGATPAAPSAGTPSSSAPSSGTGTAPAPVPGKSTPAAKPDPMDAYRVTLRFGQAGKMRTLRDIARLSPLPSTDAPFFVYLGVLDDMKTAVFLISSDVTATGDGTCRPRKTDCQTIEMRAGDTEFFDFGSDADLRQYQMDLLRVDKHQASTKAVAARLHKRVSRKGKATLRLAQSAGIAAGSFRYRYDARNGVVRRVSAKVAAKSAKAHPAPTALAGDPLYALRAILGAEAIRLARAAKH